MDSTRTCISRELILAIAICFLSSCSVKEDRWACPCHLIFKADNPSYLDRKDGFNLTVFEGDAKELSQAFSWRSIRDDDYNATVSKGEKTMSIILNKERQFISGTSLLIREGEEADSIWASSVRASCVEDIHIVPLEPRKQHANVHIVMSGYTDEDYPFSMQITSNTCGIDLISLSPIKGPYRYDPPTCHLESRELKPSVKEQMARSGFDVIWDGAQVKYSFVIMRQSYDDEPGPCLNFYKKSNSTNNYTPIKLALGNIILQSGYDWSDENLKDLFIILDFVESEGHVRVMDWETGWSDCITI